MRNKNQIVGDVYIDGVLHILIYRSDRGGIQELIKVIKSSKTPIICICNDRQSTKIRSLANSCYDLRVKRPTKTQIANRLIAIARAEGLNVEQNAAEMLVEQTGNDIRQVLPILNTT